MDHSSNHPPVQDLDKDQLLEILRKQDEISHRHGECWSEDLLPRVLPASWRRMEDRRDGVFFKHSHGLVVIVSAQVEEDGLAWLHVSLSRRRRDPSYEDVRIVKDLFVGRDRTAVQVFPSADRHVNIHPHCLHLWS